MQTHAAYFSPAKRYSTFGCAAMPREFKGALACAEDHVALGLGALRFRLPVAADLRQVVAAAAAGLAERLGLARAIIACTEGSQTQYSRDDVHKFDQTFAR